MIETPIISIIISHSFVHSAWHAIKRFHTRIAQMDECLNAWRARCTHTETPNGSLPLFILIHPRLHVQLYLKKNLANTNATRRDKCRDRKRNIAVRYKNIFIINESAPVYELQIKFSRVWRVYIKRFFNYIDKDLSISISL